MRQQSPRGLGDAVSYAEGFVSDESFAVLLGDDIIDERDVLLSRMLDLQAETGGIVVGLIEVEGRFISLYGRIQPAGAVVDGVIEIETLIEKPKPEEALSNLA
ncbi:sugar phosphate nucleotidyltransferase, partial [Acinetobacter baumannii]|uniref:sugar phosphate nucleotidyltransferase n=1 Tax=Acinetobacter baumannii TaxID=470 RepID=UPI002243E595